MTQRTDLQQVLSAWGAGQGQVRALPGGLINQTLLVEHPSRGRFVLQRLNPLFAPEVNEDIDAITRHLAARGVTTPLLLRTDAGEAWHREGDAVWRALTWVDGHSLQRLSAPDQAREAGLLLGRFHHALRDLKHEFRARRLGVHDTQRHLAGLRQAVDARRGHPRHGDIAPQAARILAAAARLPALPATAERIVHGDPKANNILFSGDGRHAICLIDLDTIAPMSLPLELGDAFRSWCNPGGEDDARSGFAVELLAAGLRGYAAGNRLEPAEAAAIVPAIATIYIELAARFCADALNESYFGWDPVRFTSRSHHNQVRAESQLRAAESLESQRALAEAAARAALE